MIVSPQEYNNLLHRLTNPNEFMGFFRIPDDEPIYEIDLNTRTIHAPEFLSVEEDHRAEIVWFKAPRFFDNIDLYDSACWIQYINADKEQYFYAAPLIVGANEHGNEELLIPWAISEQVAKTAGQIQFSFQFFKLSEDKTQTLFVLNTTPAKSKILNGMRIDPLAFLKNDGAGSELTDIPERKWLESELRNLTAAYGAIQNYVLTWEDRF